MSTSCDEESRRATCNRPQREGDAGAGRCSDVPPGWRAGEQDAVTKARSSLSALTAVLLYACACTHPKTGSGGPPDGTPVLPPSNAASPAEARPAPVSPFQVVATGAAGVDLVPVGTSVLLKRKFPFGWLTAGQLHMDPLLAWGYPRALGESTVDPWQGRLELLALGGAPDALWAGFMEGSGVAVPDEATFRWTRRQGWRVEPPLPRLPQWTLRSFASTADRAWGLADLLAYGLGREDQLHKGAREYAIVMLRGAGPAAELPDEFCPAQLLALPAGDLYAMGVRCETKQPWLHRWPAGAVQGEVQALPPAPCVGAAANEPPELEALVRLGDEVVARTHCHGDTRSALARRSVTSGAWESFADDALALAQPASVDGSIWVDARGIWRRAADGFRTGIPLPPGWKLADAPWASTVDDIWVVAKKGADTALLHSGVAPAQPIVLPSDDALVQSLDDATQPVALTPTCQSVAIVFEGLAASHPESLDMRSVCARLGPYGLTFYQADLRGKRQLLAMADAVPQAQATPATADRLSGLLGIRLVCRNPVPHAKFRLDCPSGKLVAMPLEGD